MFAADNRRSRRRRGRRRGARGDLDAFGSPWEQAIIVADRRPVAKGERVGMVLTIGLGLSLAGNSMPRGMREVAGLKGGLVGQRREIDAIIERAVNGLARRWGVKIERRWQAIGKRGMRMTYIGLVLRGLGVIRNTSDRKLLDEFAV